MKHLSLILTILLVCSVVQADPKAEVPKEKCKPKIDMGKAVTSLLTLSQQLKKEASTAWLYNHGQPKEEIQFKLYMP